MRHDIPISVFKAAFQNAGIGLALLDFLGKILIANNQLCKATGYSLDEIKTEAFGGEVQEHDEAARQTALRRLAENKIQTYRAERRYQHKYGGHLWMRSTVARFDCETADQLATLKAEGCQFGQGYLFSKPVQPEQFMGLFTGSNQRCSAVA